MSGAAPAWIPVVVRGVRTLAEGVRQFELVHAHGAALPPVTPGSHVDVQLPGGLVRQYSLCDGPSREPPACTIAVKLAQPSRGGSAAMHALQAGHALAISAPRNLFPLHEGPGHSVLVGAGIGVTPLVSMARHLRAAGRPFEFHQFARSPAHAIAFDDGESGAIASGLARDEIRGRLAQLVRNAPAGARAYVCGPKAFMDAFIDIASTLRPGLPVAFERFDAGAASAGLAQESFVVRLARTGLAIEVPAGVSILQALADHDVHPPSSCESGMCGTCLTPVLAGLPDHRDDYLSPEERAANAAMCICVSRSATPELVLDL